MYRLDEFTAFARDSFRVESSSENSDAKRGSWRNRTLKSNRILGVVRNLLGALAAATLELPSLRTKVKISASASNSSS